MKKKLKNAILLDVVLLWVVVSWKNNKLAILQLKKSFTYWTIMYQVITIYVA
jgi:hypothetical protein